MKLENIRVSSFHLFAISHGDTTKLLRQKTRYISEKEERER